MREGEIRVIVKKPEDITGKVQIIPNTLEAFQTLVGGYIETVRLGDFVLIFNEEGRLKRMKPNIQPEGFLLPIVGPVVVAGVKEDDFDDCPLRMGEWMKQVSKWRNRKEEAKLDRQK